MGWPVAMLRSMRSRNRWRPTIRTVLVAWFGLTLALWLLVGGQITSQLASEQAAADALDARYQRAQNALATIRSDVLLASVVVRDALLDTGSRAAPESRRAIEASDAAIEASLRQYAPVTGSQAEFARLDRLRREVQVFRKATAVILSADPQTWGNRAPALLRGFLPLRESAIAVSEETQSINRALYIEQLRLASARQAGVQRRMWTGVGLALVVSVLIAWLILRYVTRLEQTLMAQHAREEEISSDLHKLSARLVSVQEEERRRIARELHDEVGQALSAVQLELVMARTRIQRSGVAGNVLGDAQAVTDSALRSVRDLSQLLHPSALEDLGLCAALESFVTAFSKRTGIVVDLIDEGPVERISPVTERAVYRVLQEALTNVAKHADADSVVIRLREDGDRLCLVVDDDGRGFDIAAAERPGRRHGLGLLSIRERVAQLGGSVRIDSVIDRGTRLEVVVPIVPGQVEESEIVAGPPSIVGSG